MILHNNVIVRFEPSNVFIAVNRFDRAVMCVAVVSANEASDRWCDRVTAMKSYADCSDAQ